LSRHFLLTAAARTITSSAIARMSEEEAFAKFVAIRFAENGGEPYCPHCGCVTVYTLTTRKIWKCKGCRKQFSVTSGTVFASRKLTIRDYLLAIVHFTNNVKGIPALELCRELNVQYKTAFVLAHKLREVITAEQTKLVLSGIVEVDSAYFGGYKKPANVKAHRKDRRLVAERTGKKQAVVTLRQRRGRSLSFVCRNESDALQFVRDHIAPGTVIHADEASGWNDLHAEYETHRINHSNEYVTVESNTNFVESSFSRLRRAEIGQHHHISGGYLIRYANEMNWREDFRRQSNGWQWNTLTALALHHSKSEFAGYWQRRAA